MHGPTPFRPQTSGSASACFVSKVRTDPRTDPDSAPLAMTPVRRTQPLPPWRRVSVNVAPQARIVSPRVIEGSALKAAVTAAKHDISCSFNDFDSIRFEELGIECCHARNLQPDIHYPNKPHVALLHGELTSALRIPAFDFLSRHRSNTSTPLRICILSVHREREDQHRRNQYDRGPKMPL